MLDASRRKCCHGSIEAGVSSTPVLELVSVSIKGGVEASCAAAIAAPVTATPPQATMLCYHHCCHCRNMGLPAMALRRCSAIAGNPEFLQPLLASSSSSSLVGEDHNDCNCVPVVDNKDNNNNDGDLP